MSYSILRVEKVKNANVTRALQRHNQRENKSYSNQDIDLTKTHLNYDLVNEKHMLIRNEDGKMESVIKQNIDYEQKIEERLQEGYKGKRKIRSDAIKLVDGIITSDKAFFDKLSKREQDRFFKDSLEFIENEYGEKNILYATVHYDEKTPHMHFGFVPLTEDGRLSAKEVLGFKEDMSKLQDQYNDFINERGFNLERGEKATGREHIEMMKFKEKTLNEKVSGLEKEVNELERNLEKVNNVDQRVKEVDNFDNKTKRVFNQVTMNKADYESFKSVAKSGIATLHKFEELKKTSTETFQELNQTNQELQKENDYFMNRNYQLLQEKKSLKTENDELKKEKRSLKRELERYKTFVKSFGEQVKMRMKKLTENLEIPKLYEAFKQYAFEPPKDFSSNEYRKDLEQERKELASEKEKDNEIEL